MRPVTPVPTHAMHGNELYPLPPNIVELSELDPEAARLARINAARQYLLTRDQIAQVLSDAYGAENWAGLPKSERLRLVESYRAEAYVASVRFFDEWYLQPDPEADFDPLFYDSEPLPTPEYHWDILRSWALDPASIAVAPRGGAKSMLTRKAMAHGLITKDSFKILYCTSSEKNATETAQLVRSQCYLNARVQADFGPEMPGGKTKPPKGDAPSGIEWFQLTNGSQLVTYSVNSKMRGGRPAWFVLDDPEHDPHASTSMAERRSYMNRLIFKIVMPMLMKAGSRISWLATFVSKRHYAWLAMETDKTIENGVVVENSKIKEFNYWKRTIIKACWTDAEGNLQSCWPHMWPVNDAQKEELNLDPTTRTLPMIRKMIGTSNFNSEYLANPGSSDEIYFNINDQNHSWWILNGTMDTQFQTNPLQSKATIQWREGDEIKSLALHDFIRSSRLFITIDTSKTAKPDSDFKVCTLMCLHKQVLFVLDMWAGKTNPEKLIAAAFSMANRWGCRRIAPEEIDDGLVLCRTMKNMTNRIAKELGPDKAPVVQGFNPGFTRKTAKISALIMRVEHGLIKLPFFLRGRAPWADLFDQFESFNPDVEDGGLSHDDHLDTVSMSEYVVGMKLRAVDAPVEAESDPLKLLLQGKRLTDDGMPLSFFIDFAKLSVAQVDAILSSQAIQQQDKNFI